MTARMEASLVLFNDTLRAFSRVIVPEKLVQFHKAVCLQVLTGVVIRTPVDTGRARGGWQLDIGGPRQSEEDRRDRAGSETITKESANLQGLKFGQVVAISNNVDYIEYLEEGSSQQAPQGMVAVTLTQVGAQFR